MRFWPALAAALLTGCAYTGDPLPPLANIPERVSDLTAVQRGNAVVIEFSVPRLTTEGMAIKRELEYDLRIGPGGDPFDENAWAAGARPVTAGKVENFRARYEVPATEFVNKEVVVAVRVTGANRRTAGWSNFVVTPVLPPPEQPREVRAESIAGGVKVTWKAAGPEFRVFRRQGEEPFAELASARAPEYADLTAEPGREYVYRVQTVVRHGERTAESEPSEEVRIVPVDRFAPAVPAGVTALASPSSIELTWEPNNEPDLAGYRVYRAAPGEEFRRVAEPSGAPGYSDRTVEAGKTYRYAVSAVDRTGNESGRSPVVEAGLP